jgi:hypothetical protein
MNPCHRILVFLAFTLIVSSPSSAQHVRTDYDRGTNFSQYKTYSWEQVQTENPLWVNRMKDAVNSALASKGWTAVGSGGSVAIMAMEITRTHRTLNTYYDSFGGGWRRGGGIGFGDATTTEDTYRVGTLVVDLFDSKTKNLVWRGSTSDVLYDKSEKNIKNLHIGVQKMFGHFPPESKNQQGH